jgi:hypothetical protein
VIGVPPRPLAELGVLSQVSGPPEAVPDQRSTPTGRPSTGERIARRFFELCENPRTRERVMRMVRSSADSAVGGRLLVALLSRTVMTPLLRSRRVDGLAVKTELVAAQLGGIAVLRYVTGMEPVASMSVDDLVAFVGPSLQATLDAPPRGVRPSTDPEDEIGPRHQG